MAHRATLIDVIGATAHFTSQLVKALKSGLACDVVLLTVNPSEIKANRLVPRFTYKIITLALLVKNYIVLFSRAINCSKDQLFIFNIPLVPSIEVFFVWLVAQRSGVSVGILHNEEPSHGERNLIRNYRYIEFYNRCDIVVFHDPSISEKFHQMFPDALPVLSNVPSYSVPDFSNYDRKKTSKVGAIKIALLGTIRRYKNLEIIFPEFEMLGHQQRKSLSLRVAGKSFYDVKRLIEDLESLCLGEFSFTDDFLEDEQFYKEMMDCDFLLVPHSSSSGSALLSVASALGVPIIGSDLPVVREVIARNRSGVVFDHLSRGDLCRVVSRLLNDPRSVQVLKDNAERAVGSTLGWDSYVDKLRVVCVGLSARRNDDSYG